MNIFYTLEGQIIQDNHYHYFVRYDDFNNVVTSDKPTEALAFYPREEAIKFLNSNSDLAKTFKVQAIITNNPPKFKFKGIILVERKQNEH